MYDVLHNLDLDKKEAMENALSEAHSQTPADYKKRFDLDYSNGSYLYNWGNAFTLLKRNLSDLGMVIVDLDRGPLWPYCLAYDKETKILYYWTKDDNLDRLRKSREKDFVNHYIYNLAYINRHLDHAGGSPIPFDVKYSTSDYDFKMNDLSDMVKSLPEMPEHFVLVTIDTTSSRVNSITAVLPDIYLGEIDSHQWEVPVNYDIIHPEEQLDDEDPYKKMLGFQKELEEETIDIEDQDQDEENNIELHVNNDK